MAVLTDREVNDIRKKVIARDGGRCVIHGTLGADVHEVLQKSSGTRNSSLVFIIDYMACVCQDCHYRIHHGSRGGERWKINLKILSILASRHGYKYPKLVIERMTEKLQVSKRKMK